jgi:hypothetical protein
MTPVEKRALDLRAKRAGTSTAEFVRRRLNADDLDDHREEIEALLSTLESTAPSILKSIDALEADTREFSARLDALSGIPK